MVALYGLPNSNGQLDPRIALFVPTPTESATMGRALQSTPSRTPEPMAGLFGKMLRKGGFERNLKKTLALAAASARSQHPLNFPTKYRISYDDTKKEYTVVLEGFVKR